MEQELQGLIVAAVHIVDEDDKSAIVDHPQQYR